MSEVLPIRVLTDEDSQIFGNLNVTLGKLNRVGLPIGAGIVVTAPNLSLKTTLEHYELGSKETFEQSLILVKAEIEKIPVPASLTEETKKYSKFLVNGATVNSVHKLWLQLLAVWLKEIKKRIWNNGFSKGITEGLDPEVVIFVKDIKAFGSAYFDVTSDDTVINIKSGNIHPNDLKNLDKYIKEANKRLFIPHEYEWIEDKGIKLIKVLPFTPSTFSSSLPVQTSQNGFNSLRQEAKKSATKVFLDLSKALVVEKQVDGVYIASEKIFDLNKPGDSFEDLVFKLVESAVTFPDSPVLFKLADKSEGMGKVRGTLRLLHQKSLFDPMVDALDFVRHKKGLTNVAVVIPFVRGVNEFLQIKRELAGRKLMRKNSLKFWLELAVPENIVNVSHYLEVGLDGVVLNLDELIAHLNGFDVSCESLLFYKNEFSGLMNFLRDSLKLLHKSKIPFIAYGTLSLYQQVLEFLVEKGVYGIVVEKYEAHSFKDLLNQTEKRMILKRLHPQ